MRLPIALVLLHVAIAAANPPPTGTIEGVVTDARHAPVVAAAVIAGDHVALTDRTGAYRLDGVPLGRQAVAIYYGDAVVTRDARVVAAAAATVSVTIPRDTRPLAPATRASPCDLFPECTRPIRRHG